MFSVPEDNLMLQLRRDKAKIATLQQQLTAALKEDGNNATVRKSHSGTGGVSNNHDNLLEGTAADVNASDRTRKYINLACGE